MQVHQPSEDMLHQWHQLVLLAAGRIAYAGPIYDVRKHLLSIGFRSNSEDNPVEFALELMGDPKKVDQIVSEWARFTAQMDGVPSRLINTSVTSTVNVTNIGVPAGSKKQFDSHMRLASTSETFTVSETSVSKGSISGATRSETSLYFQVNTLARRNLYYKVKSINGITAMFGRNVIAACLFCLLYHGNGEKLDEQTNIIDPVTGVFTPYCVNILGLSFTALICLCFANAIAIPSMFSWKRLYDKEQVNLRLFIVKKYLNMGNNIYYLIICLG